LADQAASGGLSSGERAELERLRAEVEGLRDRPAAAPAPPSPRHRFSWRTPVASILIIAGCLLAPLSVVAVWTANQVSDTSRYVENVSPLIREPAIQRALTDKVSAEISSQLNVKALAGNAATLLTQRGLPRVGALLQTFSGTLAGAVDGFIHSTVGKIVASPQMARLWDQVNRSAHAQLVKALSGQGGGAITVSNGQVQLDLAPFIDQVKADLSARGFTLVNSLPPIHPTFPLFSAKYLVKAQTGYRILNDLKWVLPIAALVLLAAGVYVARGHRRALIGAGLGFAAAMLTLGAALAVFRGVYLGSVPGSVPADAAAALFDTLVRFIKDALRVLLVVGLIVALGGFFTGPSVTAVRTRRALASGLARLRTSGERAGLRTGPVGRWTWAHHTGLRVVAVAVAALVFVFWGQPTLPLVMVIVILLLVALGLIELIGRPPARRAAGHAGG
jgi:hypothetical protein